MPEATAIGCAVDRIGSLGIAELRLEGQQLIGRAGRIAEDLTKWISR